MFEIGLVDSMVACLMSYEATGLLLYVMDGLHGQYVSLACYILCLLLLTPK